MRMTNAVAVLVLALAPAAAAENVTISVSKIKDLNIRLYGFVETDVIADTTQSFNEEQGNNLVSKRFAAGNSTVGSFAGQHHRTQMSVRNSRLGFDLTLPKQNDLAAEAVIELDFLGNNGSNAAPGNAPGAQTERDFFNNPAVRVRHAYASLTWKDDYNFKAGQFWSLLGWQPYYFPGEAIVQPGPGQLYRRFAQLRGTYTNTRLVPDWSLEAAADAAKPAEMNSGSPEYHAGLRAASTKWKAASIGGAGTSMVGLSAAVSGAVIPINTQSLGSPTGGAYAVDVAIPIIPSKDGKDRSNNLVVMGEFMSGSGVGGLEYSGLSLGVPGIAATTANAGTAIDSGIAGINNSGEAELVKYRAFRAHTQYCLPGGKWALSAGYAQVEGRNLSRFSPTVVASNALAPKIQFGYLSAFYDAASWLRFAGEINQTKDTYNDAANRTAINNRYQFTTYFVF